MSSELFHPAELLELLSNLRKKDCRIIFHEFEVVEPSRTV